MDERDPQGAQASGRLAGDDDLPPELRAVALRYAARPVPRPTPEQTARLLARLLAEEPSAARAAFPRRGRVLPALRVARWRVRLLGPWFWVASVLLLAGGAAITLFQHGSNAALPLVLLAPLTAVLGIAHAVRTSSGGLRAVEASVPVGVVEVTAGLVLAIVGFDCALGVAATVGLALIHWAPFVALLSAWLGPLLLLAGVSLPIALRWGTVPAVVVGAGPWLALALAAALAPGSVCATFFIVPRDAASELAHAGAAAGGLLLLLVLLRGGTWRTLALPQRM